MQKTGKKNNIAISICIPTYNRLEILQETLSSITGLKGLKDIDYEIIISDDSNNNHTEKYINNIGNNKIKYYRNLNKGQFNSLNNLINKSTKEWILFIHDDDLLNANYINKILPWIITEPEIEVIWTGREFIKNNRKIQDFLASKAKIGEEIVLEDSELERILLSGGYFGKDKYVGMMVTGLLAKKKLIKEVGVFDPNITVNADTLFINKLQFLASKALYINLPLIKYRISDESERGKPSKEGIVYLEMNKILARTLEFMEEYLTKEDYEKMKYIYQKNFFKNILILNGPLLWIALRYEGSYLKKLKIQYEIIRDVFNKYPFIYLNPKTIIVVLISLLPQYALKKFYILYLKYI